MIEALAAVHCFFLRGYAREITNFQGGRVGKPAGKSYLEV